MSERITGLYKLTQWSGAYSRFQSLLGGDGAIRKLVEDYIAPLGARRILDFGCGPAHVLRHLDCDHYVGIDRNGEHIDAARRVHGDRGQFICGDFEDFARDAAEQFDTVLCLGFFHHLDDERAASVAGMAQSVLKPEGVLVAIDPAFVKGQHIVARWMAKLDSGKHVRAPEAYSALLAPSFASVTSEVRHDLLSIPYTHCITRAWR